VASGAVGGATSGGKGCHHASRAKHAELEAPHRDEEGEPGIDRSRRQHIEGGTRTGSRAARRAGARLLGPGRNDRGRVKARILVRRAWAEPARRRVRAKAASVGANRESMSAIARTRFRRRCRRPTTPRDVQNRERTRGQLPTSSIPSSWSGRARSGSSASIGPVSSSPIEEGSLPGDSKIAQLRNSSPRRDR